MVLDTSSSMDAYFGSNISYCKDVNVSAYIYNITSPYTDSVNRVSIVGTTVAMFTLNALFFNLTMFRRLSCSIRLARSLAVSLFHLVMSYLFFEAQNVSTPSISNMVIDEVSPRELPLWARLILTWLLLEELLHNKAEPMWVPEAAADPGALVAGYSGHAERAGRIVWLGSLVFTSIQSPGRRAVFGALWTVAAAKMVQRLVVTAVLRRRPEPRGHERLSSPGSRPPEEHPERRHGLSSGELRLGGDGGGRHGQEDRATRLGCRQRHSPQQRGHRRQGLDGGQDTQVSQEETVLLIRALQAPAPAVGGPRANRRQRPPGGGPRLILGSDLEPSQLFRVLAEEVNFLS